MAAGRVNRFGKGFAAFAPLRFTVRRASGGQDSDPSFHRQMSSRIPLNIRTGSPARHSVRLQGTRLSGRRKPGAEGAALAEAGKVQGASCKGHRSANANGNAAARGFPRATVKSCERYRACNQRSMPSTSIASTFYAGHRTPADPITRRIGGKLTIFTGAPPEVLGCEC